MFLLLAELFLLLLLLVLLRETILPARGNAVNSCRDMSNVVWSNLKAHHYREDLTRVGDDGSAADKVRHYI